MSIAPSFVPSSSSAPYGTEQPSALVVEMVDFQQSYLVKQAKRLKLFGITYLVGKISRSNCFFQGPGRLSEAIVLILFAPNC